LPPDAYRIVPFTRHRMIAGENGCDIIEVSTPELERLPGVDVEDLANIALGVREFGPRRLSGTSNP
jgi:hypothetical protein